MKNLHTNIIAGAFKNKKIQLPPLSITRSSKKILRESFFNTISFDIYEKTFVEVFSGSGSMGIEAISRGVDFAIFFEKNKYAYDVLLKNIKDLKIENYKINMGDSFEIFTQNIENIDSQHNVIFYFDPPFDIRENYEDVYKKTISLIEKIPTSMIYLVCVEHNSDVIFDEQIGYLAKTKSKKFGKSTLSYYKL